MEPSSSDLRYFIEVAKHGNISKAAANIGISQPSLSVALKRIEQCLGEKILIRGKRGTKLTKSGEVLFASSLSMIQAWDQIAIQVKSVNFKISGEYTIGCHSEVAIDSLPLFLPDLLEKFPELSINLKHNLSRAITSDVIDSKIDIGIVVNPQLHPDLIIKNLTNDQVSFWVGPGAKPIQSPFLSEAVLVCDTELHQSQLLIEKSKKAGFKFRRIISTSDLEVALALVANGCGVGIFPSDVALRHSYLKLKRIPNSPAISDQVALIYRMENRCVTAINEIVAAITVGHQKKYRTKP